MSDQEVDSERFRQLLLDRARALQETRDARREAGQTVELDQQRTGRLSRMDALQGQAMAKAGEERVARELQHIEAALARIERGEYGLCLDCDEPIATGRLEANPSATLCIRCASQYD
jgi:DnaK suppressor protein